MTAPVETRAVVPVTSAVDPQVAAAMKIKTQLETVKSVLAPDLTDQELQLFAMVAQRLELDPFIRQIHAIARGRDRDRRVTFQVGIDGFRSSAEETGQYRGSDEPEFGPDVAMPFRHPEWASIVIHRQYPDGTLRDQSAKVWWDEFYPGAGNNDFMWKKMPRNQLAKCAEAAGFRKAFPKRFANVYAPEEMDQADAAALAKPVAPTARERAAERRAAIEAQSGGAEPAAGTSVGTQGASSAGSGPAAAAPTQEAGRTRGRRRGLDEAREPAEPGAEAILAAGTGSADAPGATAITEGDFVDVTDELDFGETKRDLAARLDTAAVANASLTDPATPEQRQQLKTVLAGLSSEDVSSVLFHVLDVAELKAITRGEAQAVLEVAAATDPEQLRAEWRELAATFAAKEAAG